MKKGISILGSTGSIGKQTLEVISAFPSSFNVVGIAAKDEVEIILEQVKKFKPLIVAVESKKAQAALEEKLKGQKVRILQGEEGLLEVSTMPEAKLLVVAVPGALTLFPVIEAIRAKKDIALATKEVLVSAGDLFMEEVREAKVKVYPIDSEHSAVWQCLNGEDPKKIKKIILTASGGTFLKTPKEKLEKMTARDALKHPTWKMGPKITIDSATLMNKGFEVMEAHHLFSVDYSKIEVVVHPQSIIHSMVEFVDGSVMAQLSHPDMRIPIQHALFGMQRSQNMWNKLDITKVKNLSFEKPDKEKFPCLQYAYDAGKKGGTYPAVLNAANEEAVNLFLKDKITYPQIAIKIHEAIQKHSSTDKPELEKIMEADSWARGLFK